MQIFLILVIFRVVSGGSFDVCPEQEPSRNDFISVKQGKDCLYLCEFLNYKTLSRSDMKIPDKVSVHQTVPVYINLKWSGNRIGQKLWPNLIISLLYNMCNWYQTQVLSPSPSTAHCVILWQNMGDNVSPCHILSR